MSIEKSDFHQKPEENIESFNPEENKEHLVVKEEKANLDELLNSPIKERIFEEQANESDHNDYKEDTNYRFRSKEMTEFPESKRQMNKESTLGLSIGTKEISYAEMKKLIKEDSDAMQRILQTFKNIDTIEYQTFINTKVSPKKVENVFNEFYLLANNFAECSLIYLMNSYDEIGIVRLFSSFFLKFDADGDRNIEKSELESCIEFLGKDCYIGRVKMIEALDEIGVDCKNSLSFFQEGGAAKRILNDETSIKLFQRFKQDKNTDKEIVEFYKIAPLMIVFFIEYKVKVFLQKRARYQLHLGFPYKTNEIGKKIFDPSKKPKGLYKSFVNELQGKNDREAPILTYRIVSKALIAYRATGLCDSLTMEAIESIMKTVKEMMKVDSVSGIEKRKYSMKELLKYLAARISTETTSLSASAIEKTDESIN